MFPKMEDDLYFLEKERQSKFFGGLKMTSSKELNHKFQKLRSGFKLDEKPKIYSCKLCEATFANVDRLRNHMRTHVE